MTKVNLFLGVVGPPHAKKKTKTKLFILGPKFVFLLVFLVFPLPTFGFLVVVIIVKKAESNKTFFSPYFFSPAKKRFLFFIRWSFERELDGQLLPFLGP